MPFRAYLATRLAQLAADLVVEAHTRGGDDTIISVSIDGWRVTLTAEHDDDTLPSTATDTSSDAQTEVTGDRPRRDVELCILEAIGNMTLSVSDLARRAGYTANSYFRQAVADLISDGLLVRRGRTVRRAT